MAGSGPVIPVIKDIHRCRLPIETSKRRARGIASDEAHAWARSLKLKNADAKNVLRALAIYCNSEGSCFVGIDQLALDTDLSADTVRRRLVWLEEIGAVRRLPQYIDRAGRRNPVSGKRTTDEIRLNLDGDQELIEARARGEIDAENEAISSAISPSTEQGLNPGQPSVSPRLALAVQPPPNPLNHEPESVADDARASISKSAFDLAEQLLVIAGHAKDFWPPGWCGAPMRVQTWLASGWNPDIIIAATKAAMIRKTGPPPNSVQFFEKAIAVEVARHNRPLPETNDVQLPRPDHALKPRGNAYARIAARLDRSSG